MDMLLGLRAFRTVHSDRLLFFFEVIQGFDVMSKRIIIHCWVLLAPSKTIEYSQDCHLGEQSIFSPYEVSHELIAIQGLEKTIERNDDLRSE